MIKTSAQLASAAKAAAQNSKTLYIRGCFGAPMNESNQKRYTNNHSYNRKPERTAKIRAADGDTFGFDCVCFVKGLLWGWAADASKVYGGAVYKSNEVPDINADTMITKCEAVSEDFSDIQVGEFLWLKGHCGIYIGEGLAVEATPKWRDGVQITAVHNIGRKAGYNGRSWTSHGKLPYVTYEDPNTYTLELPQLCRGCKGETVEAIQMLLIQRGYSCGASGVDGSFGGATERAVRMFQRDCELEETGTVEQNTMGCLLGM